MRRVALCAVTLLVVVAACGDDETGNKNTTNTTSNTANAANTTANTTTNTANSTSKGTMQEKLQGVWKLTKFMCGTTDMSAQFTENATVIVTITGSVFAIANDESGCKETETRDVSYDEAKSQITLTPSATPSVCVPATCKDSCGNTDGSTEVFNIAFANTTFVITADDAKTFPNDSCEANAQPGEATFTKQ